MNAPSPYFSLERAAWVSYVILWGQRTAELRRVEGPEGFHEYRHAVEASRFLIGSLGR